MFSDSNSEVASYLGDDLVFDSLLEHFGVHDLARGAALGGELVLHLLVELEEDFVKNCTANCRIVQSVRLIFTSDDRCVVRVGVTVLKVCLIRALILLQDAWLDVESQEAML